MKKRIATCLMAGLMALTAAVGCSPTASNTPTNSPAPVVEATSAPANNDPLPEAVVTQPIADESISQLYESLDPSTTAEITIMMWSGDDMYHADLGHQNWAPEDINGQNVGALYATAKAFNEIYPNIKINLTTQWNWDVSWAQNQENFKAEYGRYPDIIASQDLATGIELGMIADLSVFKDDPVYQSINPAIMDMMNFYGFQAGLPSFVMPYYVAVNKTLAEENNIDVPPVNWNIDQLTDFISHADNENFYGMGDFNSARLANLGTKDIMYQLGNRKAGEPYVKLNSDAVKDILSYTTRWSPYTVWELFYQGKVTQEFMDAYWSWDLKMWASGIALISMSDSWMLGDIVHGSLPDNNGSDPTKNAYWLANNFEFDLYPYPSTAYQPNTVAVSLDPFVIHNYAADNGGTHNDETLNKLKISYEFLKFYISDTRAWEARAKQYFKDGDGNIRPATNDCFPLTTGEEFDRQMELWFMADNHSKLKDADQYPGFHEVVRIWKSGQIWDMSANCYPGLYDQDGTPTNVLNEWENQWNVDIVGAYRSDPNWLDQVKAKLPDWDRLANERFEQSHQRLQGALIKYYGFTAADFE